MPNSAQYQNRAFVRKPVRRKQRASQPPRTEALKARAYGSRPARALPAPRPAPAYRPPAPQPTRATARSYVSQGRAVEKAAKSQQRAAYAGQSVAGRRATVRKAWTTPKPQRTSAQRAAIQVHHERHAGDVVAKKRIGMTERAADRLGAQARAEHVSQGQAVEKAAGEQKRKAEDRAKNAPIQIAGISTHIRPGVAKAVATSLPGIKNAYAGYKVVTSPTAKQIAAPALTALEQTERVGYGIKGSLKADLKRGGVKEAFFGVHAPGSAAAKERGRAFERGVTLKEKTSGADVLKAAGVKNKAVRAVGGFVTDVGIDAATLPGGGLKSVAEKAGGKAFARTAVKASATGRRAGRRAAAQAAAEGKSAAQQKAAHAAAAQTAKRRTRAAAERNRAAAARAAEEKVGTGKGVAVRYLGHEVPGVRRATAAAGRKARKVTGHQRAKTYAEQHAERKFEHAERSARASREGSAATARRVATRAHKDIRTDEHAYVAAALDRGDIRSLTPSWRKALKKAHGDRRAAQKIMEREHPDEARLARAAHDLRSTFEHAHRAERRAGTSAKTNADNFLSKSDRAAVKDAAKKQRGETKRSVASAKVKEERAQSRAGLHEVVGEERHAARGKVAQAVAPVRARVEQVQQAGRAKVATEKVRGKESKRVGVQTARAQGDAKVQTARATGQAATGRQRDIGTVRAARDAAKVRLRDELRKPVTKRKGVAALNVKLDVAERDLANARGPLTRPPAVEPKAVDPAARVSAVRPPLPEPRVAEPEVTPESLAAAMRHVRDEKTGARLTNVKGGRFGEDRYVVSGDIVLGGKKIGRVSRFYDPRTRALIKESTRIDTEHQGKGIASRLARSEEHHAARAGARRVEVVPLGEAGEKLTARVGGFKPVGEHAPGRMAKALTPPVEAKPRTVGSREGKAAQKYVRAVGRRERQQARHAAAKNVPRQGRGSGVPLGETHAQWLARVRAHGAAHNLPRLTEKADELLAKSPKADEVAGGYFPREFEDRAAKTLGLGKRGGGKATRSGSRRIATPATGGHARSDVRRLDIVNREARGADKPEFSTNVPLVAGARVRDAGRAVAESRLARDVAAQGRAVTSADDLRDGEKLYRAGRKGGQFGLHPAKSVPRDVQQEWRQYHAAVAAVPRRGRSAEDIAKDVKAIDKPAPQGKTRQPGQHVALPEHLVDRMNEANQPLPNIDSKVLRAWDGFTAGFKTLATANPAFHIRNALGDIARLTEMPGNPFGNVARLGSGAKAARAVRQSERYRQAPGKVFGSRPQDATIKVAGKDMSAKKFADMMREHNLLDAGQASQEKRELRQLTSGKSPELGSIRPTRAPRRALASAGRPLTVDTPNAIRAAAFKAGLDMGLEPGEAADLAHKFFVDYGKLSPAERTYGRRVMPFYTWTRQSLPATVANFAAHPARYANLDAARMEWNQAVTGMSEDEQRKMMSPGTEKTIPLMVPLGGGKYAAVSASWPAALLNLVPTGTSGKATLGAGQEAINTTVGLSHPGLRGFWELATGTNAATRRQIEPLNSPRTAAPDWVQYLPPAAKKELGVVDTFEDKRTGKQTWGWRGWADWTWRNASPGLPGQVAAATEGGRPGQAKTPVATVAGMLGVRMDDFGPQVQKYGERVAKFKRQAELNKRLAFLGGDGVNADHPTPEYRKLRAEVNKLHAELTPSKHKKKKVVGPLPLGGGGGPKLLPLGGGAGAAKLPLG